MRKSARYPRPQRGAENDKPDADGCDGGDEDHAGGEVLGDFRFGVDFGGGEIDGGFYRCVETFENQDGGDGEDEDGPFGAGDAEPEG